MLELNIDKLVTTILTCQGGEIIPRTDRKANIACLMGIRPDVFK